MNLVIFSQEDYISSDRVRLTGRRADHINTVLKSKPGDILAAGMLNGKIGQGTVVRVGEEVLLDVVIDAMPPPPLPLKLVLALPRPHLFKRSLFFASMLGIKEIHVLNFSRVEKSLWNSSSLRPDTVHEQLVLGLEQSKDTILPIVVLHPVFKSFVQDGLPGIIKGTKALIAHPGGQKIGNNLPQAPVTLVIGPEGGIVPVEIDLLASIGFETVDLGYRILRVDAALVYSCGLIDRLGRE